MPPPQDPPSPTRASPPRSIVTQRHSISRKPLSAEPQPPPPQPAYEGPVSPYQSTRTSYDYQPHERTVSDLGPGPEIAGAAAGAMAGAAYGAVDNAPRDGSAQALRDVDNLYAPGNMGHDDPISRDHTPYHDARETPYNQGPPQRIPFHPQDSSSSMAPLAAGAYAPGQATPRSFNSTPALTPLEGPPATRQLNSYIPPGRGHFRPPPAAGVASAAAIPPGPPPHAPQAQDPRQSWFANPYDSHSISRAPAGINDIDPTSIADDGDDGLEYLPQNPKRKSMLSLGRSNESRSSLGPAAALGAAGAGAAAGAATAAAVPPPQSRGLFGANPGSRDASGTYAPVPGGAGAGGNAAGSGAGDSFDNIAEKGQNSEWLASQTSGRKRMRWIIGSIIGVVLILAIVGGTVGGVLASRNSSNSKAAAGRVGESAAQDDGSGLLDKNSKETQDLMNNKDLHKVFPGFDYTPINTQYPDCLSNPPSQNNVTRDLAVLSQLTNTLRLYGNDCNQTELVIEAIDRLDLDDMKLWLGVWLGPNKTTNARQVDTAWQILDKHGADPFVGVAVANEVLFRKELTSTELATYLSTFRSNLTEKDIKLPVVTSDLGSNWTPELASESDMIFANIHPFFAGVTAADAAGWTWDFMQNNDVTVASQGQKVVISEVGWPSSGGNDCGTTDSGQENPCTSDTDGSVAGVKEMTQFMGDWVCQSLQNQTEYFWYVEIWRLSLRRTNAACQV
ncbi:MAG: hypothetical protein INR71_02550 [Terriglobus roseus]|nr:hypothetical protein [Terriglobus roseus]